MLACLGHYSFVGSYYKADQIDAAGSCSHGLDEAFVSRNIDDAKALALKIEIGEAELSSDAPDFLFFQAIGVDSGESLY
jgi:hypothetical protein